jgi:transposase
MEMLLTMSPKEREKLKLMHDLAQAKISRSVAAERLGLSERHVYRLYAQYRKDGDEGVIHGLRGTHSNRAYPLKIRVAALELFVKHYSDYGPTLLSEILETEHDISVAPETLRRWLLAKKLWTLHRKARRHRKRRERREAIGSLIQFDGSEHDWFENRGPRCTLLVAIDDASNRVMLRFAESESTQAVLSFWIDYVKRYGIPKETYTDFGAVYYNTNNPEQLTDFGLAMTTLGVKLNYAHSPQAKGRVERSNRTFQDRLLKALRREKISSIDLANDYLDRLFTNEYNKRFAQLEALEDVHRPCAYSQGELRNIFCFTSTRSVYNDDTITLDAQWIQLERSKAPLPPSRSKVTLRRWLDGSLHIFWQQDELAFTILKKKPHHKPKPPMRGFQEHPWRAKAKLFGSARVRAKMR